MLVTIGTLRVKMQGYHRRPKFTTISIQYFQPEFLWLKNDVTESTHHLFFL